MHRPIQHLRSNAIAYLALFVALGGTSYAAISIPRNSVGTRQLRNGAVSNRKLANGSITPAKLNPTMIGASVRAWAEITPSGNVTASEPAQAVNWNPPNQPGTGQVRFAHAFPNTGCFTLANVEGITKAPPPTAGIASATPITVEPATGSSLNGVAVDIFNVNGTPAAGLPVLVVVLCSR